GARAAAREGEPSRVGRDVVPGHRLEIPGEAAQGPARPAREFAGRTRLPRDCGERPGSRADLDAPRAGPGLSQQALEPRRVDARQHRLRVPEPPVVLETGAAQALGTRVRFESTSSRTRLL